MSLWHCNILIVFFFFLHKLANWWHLRFITATFITEAWTRMGLIMALKSSIFQKSTYSPTPNMPLDINKTGNIFDSLSFCTCKTWSHVSYNLKHNLIWNMCAVLVPVDHCYINLTKKSNEICKNTKWLRALRRLPDGLTQVLFCYGWTINTNWEFAEALREFGKKY